MGLANQILLGRFVENILVWIFIKGLLVLVVLSAACSNRWSQRCVRLVALVFCFLSSCWFIFVLQHNLRYRHISLFLSLWVSLKSYGKIFAYQIVWYSISKVKRFCFSCVYGICFGKILLQHLMNIFHGPCAVLFVKTQVGILKHLFESSLFCLNLS